MSDNNPTDRAPVALYRVHGMHCAEEIAALEDAFRDVPDGEQLRFDLLGATLEAPASMPEEVVLAGVSAAGLRAERLPDENDGQGATAAPGADTTRRWGLLAGASGVCVVLGFAAHALTDGVRAAIGSEAIGEHHAAHGVPVAALVPYALAVTAGMLLVLPKAWAALRRVRPDMNLLMTIAVAGAIGLGEWFEAAAVSFLFAVSLALESWSVGRARQAVEKLLALAPATVQVHGPDGLIAVDPKQVAVGTEFVVEPGERIALDGVVLRGESDVDQAPITGESVAVAKSEGAEVFAGTINGNGALDVRSTRAAADTVLAQIMRLVGDARRDRAPSEYWVERFARVYTPVVLAVAAIVMVVPPLAFGGEWGDWFYRGLVLLVIGCPCALVVATPTAIVAGMAAAARHGVLIKGGRFLEVPASVRVVALDKTGTLTAGRPRVVSVTALDEHTDADLLGVAAAIESRSEHPIAQAIVDYADAAGTEYTAADGVEIIPGKGVTGRVQGRDYWLGSHRWLEDRGQETTELHTALEDRSSAGRSVVVIGTGDHVCGFVTLADAVRPEAAGAVASLNAAGIARVVMLTGDNRATAEAVAAAVGITDVRAELLPADKVAAVAELETEVGPVAMIGDGVNDAPALARATIGVAMGAIGTDVAVETADVVLMSDDVSRLAWLVEQSRRTLRIIRQNTVAALGIKVLFVVLTLAGVASLWGAIAADMGASLLVVFNALRLLRE